MKAQIITAVVLSGLLLTVAAGTILAAGPGNGVRGQVNAAAGGMKQQTQSQFRTQVQTHSRAQAQAQARNESSEAIRPADSQRRDGTFLTTGTTANGSGTRPANGQGLQDGSGLNAATTPAPAATP